MFSQRMPPAEMISGGWTSAVEAVGTPGSA